VRRCPDRGSAPTPLPILANNYAYLVVCEATQEAFVVDPADPQRVIRPDRSKPLGRKGILKAPPPRRGGGPLFFYGPQFSQPVDPVTLANCEKISVPILRVFFSHILNKTHTFFTLFFQRV